MEVLGQYINVKMTYARDLMGLYKRLEDPVLEKPKPDGLDLNDPVYKIEWTETVKEYMDRKRKLEDNLCAIYSVVWGQCSESMKARLRTMEDFDLKDKECDSGWLLRAIRSITLEFDDRKQFWLAVTDAWLALDWKC